MRVVDTWEEAKAILEAEYPYSVNAQGMPLLGVVEIDERDEWCQTLCETRDAHNKTANIEPVVLRLDRQWCLFNGLFRFRSSADALAFKLRWG